MKDKTKEKEPEKLEDPLFFYVSFQQHIGQPAKEIVKSGDYVKRYQLIGESQGGISAKIHSPVSGKVKEAVIPEKKNLAFLNSDSLCFNNKDKIKKAAFDVEPDKEKY